MPTITIFPATNAADELLSSVIVAAFAAQRYEVAAIEYDEDAESYRVRTSCGIGFATPIIGSDDDEFLLFIRAPHPNGGNRVRTVAVETAEMYGSDFDAGERCAICGHEFGSDAIERGAEVRGGFRCAGEPCEYRSDIADAADTSNEQESTPNPFCERCGDVVFVAGSPHQAGTRFCTCDDPTTISGALAAIRATGCSVSRTDHAEFRICGPDRKDEAAAQYATDVEDAIGSARAIAAEAARLRESQLAERERALGTCGRCGGQGFIDDPRGEGPCDRCDGSGEPPRR